MYNVATATDSNALTTLAVRSDSNTVSVMFDSQTELSLHHNLVQAQHGRL